ncbi:MAG: DUF1801 domain-containing protein [Flavobacteriales bacterium]
MNAAEIQNDIAAYHAEQSASDAAICERLYVLNQRYLPATEHKLWHAHPVWFINGNPIVGYSKQKAGIRLMFWSGADFDEAALNVRGAKFKDASIVYTSAEQVDEADLHRWLKKAVSIQYDYKNIVKRKGVLVRLV